jgi:hypothetical protein
MADGSSAAHGATAGQLRRDCRISPEHRLAQDASLLQSLFNVLRSPDILGVRKHGWLIWNNQSARRAFFDAAAIRDALIGLLPTIEAGLSPGSRLRWGMFVDDYVLPCTKQTRSPLVSAVSTQVIFNFEPDNGLLTSTAILQANRRWEHFVGVPARLRDGGDCVAYTPLGRKHPSALDHARAVDLSGFVGRSDEVARLDEAWRLSRASSRLAAIIAPPGAGKTRLVRQWLRCHAEVRFLRASFSTFGGDLMDFVGQVVELPQENTCD